MKLALYLMLTFAASSQLAAAPQDQQSVTARGLDQEGGESGLDRREDRSGQDQDGNDDLNR